MRLVYGEDAALRGWTEFRLGFRLRDDAQFIGIARQSDLVAAVAFDTFASRGCNIHVASNGGGMWLGRAPAAIVVAVLAYPFIQCGFARVTGLIDADNRRSLRLARRIGFVEEGRMRGASVSGSDLVVMGLLREDLERVSSPLHLMGRTTTPMLRST